MDMKNELDALTLSLFKMEINLTIEPTKFVTLEELNEIKNRYSIVKEKINNIRIKENNNDLYKKDEQIIDASMNKIIEAREIKKDEFFEEYIPVRKIKNPVSDFFEKNNVKISATILSGFITYLSVQTDKYMLPSFIVTGAMSCVSAISMLNWAEEYIDYCKKGYKVIDKDQTTNLEYNDYCKCKKLEK